MRAAADRVWFDTANVIMVAGLLPPGGAAVIVPATGWSVAELISHLALTQDRQAEAIEGAITGQPLAALFECAALPPATDSLAEALVALLASRDRMFAALERVKLGPGGQPSGGRGLTETALAWTEHYADHALDFTDAVPALRDDALVLNWVLWERKSTSPATRARQDALFELVKDRLAQPPEEESNRKRNLAKRLVRKK